MTVLQASPVRPLTKTIVGKVNATNGKTEYQIGQYDQKILQFSSKEVAVSNYADMCLVLNKLITDKTSCVIRGMLKTGTDKSFFMRRKASNPVGGCIEDVDQKWVCLDLDSIPLAAVGNDLKKAPAILRGMLPKCFADAACWWNYSASQGFKPEATVSIHMWFWMDDEISNTELKRYFDLFNESIKELYGINKLVDLVLFDSIQIHYTAPPDLQGVADPLSDGRYGALPGLPEVRITEDWLRDDRLDTGAVLKYVNKIGDDKEGFHNPILSASAAWVRSYGASARATAEFKALIRDSIERADKSAHTPEQVERYKSDSFLDSLIKSASAKGFDKDNVQLDGQALEFFKDHVFSSSAGKFYCIKSREWISTASFDLVARPHIKMAGAAKVFMDAGGTIVDNVLIIPGQNPMATTVFNGKKVFNRWQGRKGVLLDEYDVGPWLKHISFLCDGRENVATLLQDYFAFIIANPGKKVMWAPVLGSRIGGTGKSMLKIPLRAIYGEGMVEIGTDDVRNNFNTYMEYELVVVEEIYGPDNRMMVNQIKAKITETMSRINMKGIPQYDAPNFANFIMFTNHRVPFPIETGDRRFFFIFSESLPREQEYYRQFGAWMAANANGLYTWAMQRDLTKFSQYQAPLETDEKRNILESSMSMITQKLVYAKDHITWPLQHDLINPPELLQAINSGSKYQMSLNSLSEELRKIGAKKLGRMMAKDRSSITVWAIRDFEKYENMAQSDIVEEIKGKMIGAERDYYNGMKI